MLDAGSYGNAAAYINNSSNNATAYFLGLLGGFAGKRPVSAYTVIRMAGSPPDAQTPTERIAAPSAMIPGRQGMRPVAFPLTVGWNFDTPLT